MTALRTEDDAPRGFVPRSELYAAQRRIEALELQLAEAKSQLHEASEDGLLAKVAGVARLTGAQASIVAALIQSAGPIPFKRLIAVARIGDRYREVGANLDNTLKTQVCKIRQRLREIGCPGGVQTFLGVGYGLTPEARQWFSNRDCGGIQK